MGKWGYTYNSLLKTDRKPTLFQAPKVQAFEMTQDLCFRNMIWKAKDLHRIVSHRGFLTTTSVEIWWIWLVKKLMINFVCLKLTWGATVVFLLIKNAAKQPKSPRWDQDFQPNDARNKSPTVVTPKRERRVEEAYKHQYLGTWSLQVPTFWTSEITYHQSRKSKKVHDVHEIKKRNWTI